MVLGWRCHPKIQYAGFDELHKNEIAKIPIASHEYSPLLLSKSQQCFVIGLRKPYLGHWHYIMIQTSEETKGTGIDVLI